MILDNINKENKTLHFTIGQKKHNFIISYAQEPFVVSSMDDELSDWVLYSNIQSKHYNSLSVILHKLFNIYSDQLSLKNNEDKVKIFKQYWEKTHSIGLIKAENLEDAANGAFLGGLCSEASGAPLELMFREPKDTEVWWAMSLCGGGFHRVSPGQITDDGELTISQAWVLSEDDPSLEKLAKKYVDWMTSGPFDIGATTIKSLSCHNMLEWKNVIKEHGLAHAVTHAALNRNIKSYGNGCLMRAIPLAVWGYKLPTKDLVQFSFAETSLTNPAPSCKQAVACYRIAIAHLCFAPGDNKGALEKVFNWAEENVNDEVKDWLNSAKNNVKVPYYPESGSLKIAFTHAFRHLALQTNFAEALFETLRGGGDTDTNAMIIGGLLGACYGRKCVPEEVIKIVLSCKIGNQGKRENRPSWLLADNIIHLIPSLIKKAPDHFHFQPIC